MGDWETGPHLLLLGQVIGEQVRFRTEQVLEKSYVEAVYWQQIAKTLGKKKIKLKKKSKLWLPKHSSFLGSPARLLSNVPQSLWVKSSGHNLAY